MGIGNTLGALAVLLFVAGGYALMVGSRETAKGFITVAVVVAVLGPFVGIQVERLAQYFHEHHWAALEILASVVGLALLARLTRKKSDEKRLSLKRRVGPNE